jgi:hypothetical protein
MRPTNLDLEARDEICVSSVGSGSVTPDREKEEERDVSKDGQLRV